METLKDFTPGAKKQHQITNVKSVGDFYEIDYNYLNFEQNTAEPSTITVEKNGGAKLSLMIHFSERGFI